MNELQQLEFETIGHQDETFKITNLDQANWAFKSLMQSMLKKMRLINLLVKKLTESKIGKVTKLIN